VKNSIKSDTIRLSVIDDHPLIFLGIQLVLQKLKSHSIKLVNQYANGDDAMADIENINSDVILIDMCLPDIKGYHLAKKILEVYPEMKIGIYSGLLEREYIVNSFKYGVLGYLPKSANPYEIVNFILTIRKGERYIRGSVADIIFENDNLPDKQRTLNITKRETEILQFIFDGFKNREIADKLSIAERTVEFHKQNIYVKLSVNNSVDLYKAVLRLNLLSGKDSFI